MKQRYILTIDAGTTSVRAVLYDTKKKRIKRIERAFIQLIRPNSTWVEFDANDMWASTVGCLRRVIKGVNPYKIYGIGIANQRETVVAWNKKTGEALCNAISWQCRRTAKECADIANDQKIVDAIREKTGLIFNPYFSATKMRWLLDHSRAVQAANRARQLCFGTVESYLVYRLTNRKAFVSDITNASRTMLYNIHLHKWDPYLLKYFRINRKLLPKVVDNDKEVGISTVLGARIPVAGLIGDQQASLLGQGCYKIGMTKCTYGTGSFVMINTGDSAYPSQHNLLTTIANRLKEMDSYALEGPIFNCGTLLNSLIKKGLAESPEDLTSIASKCPSTPLYYIPGSNGLGAPYWKMDAKEKILNLRIDTPSDTIVKAACETIALRTWDIYDAIAKDLRYRPEQIYVDGGITESDYLMQLQSDILQIPVVKMNTESTCYGAMICTGLALGVFKSLADVDFEPVKVFRPQTDKKAEVEKKIVGWKKAMNEYIKTLE